MYNALEYIKYNSCIFIFGIDNWQDIVYLSKKISNNNKIIVVEPDLFVYKKYNNDIHESIILIYFDKYNIDYLNKILIQNLNIYNYKNVVIGNSINYNERYKESYNLLQSLVRDYCYKLNVAENTVESFKEINLKNSIYYLKSLNSSTLLDEYKNINKNVPAIIVSAGPSLDRNINDMVKYRKKLKNFFVIAGNRTLEPLLKNNIIPDLLVTIDPGEVAQKMIVHADFYDVPIVYYEKSNWKIINEYNGPKIAASELLLQSVCGMKNVRLTTVAGSVAHTSVDIAAFLGCNPIIFTGQDFAYTFKKNFAENARFRNSNTVGKTQSIIYLTDVFDNKVESSGLFKVYKENMEMIIKKLKDSNKIEFINCSYGAKINNAPYDELKKVLMIPIVKTKKSITNKKYINIDSKAILNGFLLYLDDFKGICDKYIEDMNKYEFSEIQINEMLQTLNKKISEKYGMLIKEYYEMFGIKYREKYFDFTIDEYNKFKADICHQNNIYFEILIMLRGTLIAIKNLVFS